jgi:hypothetical protein
MRQPQIFVTQAQKFEIPKEFVARFPDFLPSTGKNGRLCGQGETRGGAALLNATPPLFCQSLFHVGKDLFFLPGYLHLRKSQRIGRSLLRAFPEVAEKQNLPPLLRQGVDYLLEGDLSRAALNEILGG